MAIKSFRLVVGTSPTRIDTQADRDLKPNRTVLVKAEGDIYLGGPDVTVEQGFLLPSGDALPSDLGANDKLYAVAAADTNASVMMGGI